MRGFLSVWPVLLLSLCLLSSCSEEPQAVDPCSPDYTGDQICPTDVVDTGVYDGGIGDSDPADVGIIDVEDTGQGDVSDTQVPPEDGGHDAEEDGGNLDVDEPDVAGPEETDVGPTPVEVTGVTVTPATITLAVGETATLDAVVEPEDATDDRVVWSSSDPDVALVNEDGTVTGVGAGTATVTAVTEDGEHTAAAVVTVVIPVTGVAVEPESLTVGVEETGHLMAVVSPEDATDDRVVWSSSDPDVALVNEDGMVTGVGIGEAIITVTTLDGGLTAQCELIVSIYAWAQGITQAEVWAVELDGEGNILMAGEFEYNVAFPGGVTLKNGGSSDGFLAKFGGDGELIWAKTIGGDQYDVVSSLAIYPTGSVLVAGSTVSSVLDVAGTVVELEDNRSVFVARIDPDGEVEWIKTVSSESPLGCGSLALDGEGAIYVGGSYSGGDVDFGGGPFPRPGYPDGYLVKLDANGEYLWQKFYVYSRSAISVGILKVDGDGNVLAGGSFASGLTTDGVTLTNPLGVTGVGVPYLLKYNSDGDLLWSKAFGVTYEGELSDVALDGSGNIYLVGTYGGRYGNIGVIEFDGESLPESNIFVTYVAKLSGAGDHIWSKQLAANVYSGGFGVGVDQNDDVFLLGNFRETINLGGDTHTTNDDNYGYTCCYVGQLDPSADYLWSTGYSRGGRGESMNGKQLKVDRDGWVISVGQFNREVVIGENSLQIPSYGAFMTKFKR